ncbi:MAG: hypothetical protein R3B53_04430 [Candidatus Paceibacterota bacterium]
MKYYLPTFTFVLLLSFFGFFNYASALPAPSERFENFDCIKKPQVESSEPAFVYDEFCNESEYFDLGPSRRERFLTYYKTLEINDTQLNQCAELMSQANLQYYTLDCDTTLKTYIEDWRNSEMTTRQKFEKYAVYVLIPLNAYILPFLLLVSIIITPTGLILSLFKKRRPLGKKLALYGTVILASILIFWMILNIYY